MLKQVFKTHIELGITCDERHGLLKALDYLEDHTEIKKQRWYHAMLPWNPGLLFNMRFWGKNYANGAKAVCIGGLAIHLHPAARSLQKSWHENNQLANLFHPWLCSNLEFYRSYSMSDAAKTLRRYLETGKTTW